MLNLNEYETCPYLLTLSKLTYIMSYGHPLLSNLISRPPVKILLTVPGGTSFVYLYVFSVLCLLCLCARLFICALWSPAGKRLTSWLSFVVSNCEFVTFPLVFWVRCGA